MRRASPRKEINSFFEWIYTSLRIPPAQTQIKSTSTFLIFRIYGKSHKHVKLYANYERRAGSIECPNLLRYRKVLDQTIEDFQFFKLWIDWYKRQYFCFCIQKICTVLIERSTSHCQLKSYEQMKGCNQDPEHFALYRYFSVWERKKMSRVEERVIVGWKMGCGVGANGKLGDRHVMREDANYQGCTRTAGESP